MLHSSSGRPYCTTDARFQVVLPQLTELRLVALTKQLSRNRKQAYINHENIHSDQKAYEKYVAKEQKLSDDRYQYYSSPFKKRLSRVKGVQMCLRRQRTEYYLEHDEPGPFGIYSGTSIESMKNDIDKMLKDHDYNTMKRKKIEKMLADGRAEGKIVDVNTSVPRLEAILNRPSFPRRRERALGFDLAGATIHLPPVTAKKRDSALTFRPQRENAFYEDLPKQNIFYQERSKTVV